MIDVGVKTGALMNKTGALLMNKNVYVREILGMDLIGGNKDPLQEHVYASFGHNCFTAKLENHCNKRAQ